jgi:hypothetical protein
VPTLLVVNPAWTAPRLCNPVHAPVCIALLGVHGARATARTSSAGLGLDARRDDADHAPMPNDPKKPAPAAGATNVSRRRFVAGAGAAAAVLTKSALAFAAGGAAPIYRIHPAIGVSRLGNADPDTFFVGPEAPGYGPLGAPPGTDAPPYKAADGRVKPQATRFRIFEYATVNGRLVPVREVNLDTPGVLAITWNVHLANKKASFHAFLGPAGETSAPGPLRNAAVSDRRSLEIDFGPRAVSGRSQGPVEFRPGGSVGYTESCPRNVNGQAVIGYLGQLRTDAEGNLIVLGGQGQASYQSATPPPLTTYANNDGWFDDASDGPVTATVTIDDNGVARTIPIDAKGGSWILCTPPDFAPRIGGAVSGYDLLFDLAVRSIPIPPENGLYDDGGPLARLRVLKADFTPGVASELPHAVPSFTDEIQPILLAGYNYWWVDAAVTQKHNSLIDPNLGNPDPQYGKARQGVFTYIRPPAGLPTSLTGTMPHLKGDNPYVGTSNGEKFLELTHVQYALLSRWANGTFTPATGAPPPPPMISATGLDRAVLENCVGGAFFPGIEFGWQIRNASLYAEPFRLNLQATSGYWGETGVPLAAGHFTRQMAVPWHADFNDCRNEGDYGWWPSQRPNDALPSATATQRVDWARPTTEFTSGGVVSEHSDMVANWYKFGFLAEEGELFVETERAAQIP